MGSWFSEFIHEPFKKPVFLIAAVGGGLLGMATGLFSSIGSALYTAPIASGIGTGTVATGLLPTVFGVGVPGMGLVGTAAATVGGLLYTPAIASGIAPTGALTTLFGVGVPGVGLVGQVAASLIQGGARPGTDVTKQPEYSVGTIVPGVSNQNLALLGIGGVALLILLGSGRRK